MPEAEGKFNSGNLGVLVFPAGGFRRNEYVLKVGRWKVGGGGFYLSEYVPLNELSDLSHALRELAQSGWCQPHPAQLRANSGDRKRN